MQFPDDGNGDMLRALMDAGIDLSQPLAVSYTHLRAHET